MDTRAIAAEHRLSYWAGIIKERRESGLSVKAFCEGLGIHGNTYFYWQKRLREAACGEIADVQGVAAGLVPAGFTDRSAARPQTRESGGRAPVIWAGIDTKALGDADSLDGSKIKISRDGWTVTVEPGVDADLLMESLKAVRRACC